MGLEDFDKTKKGYFDRDFHLRNKEEFAPVVTSGDQATSVVKHYFAPPGNVPSRLVDMDRAAKNDQKSPDKKAPQKKKKPENNISRDLPPPEMPSFDDSQSTSTTSPVTSALTDTTNRVATFLRSLTESQGGKKRTKKGKKAKKNKSKKAKKSSSHRSTKKHAKKHSKKHAKKHAKKHTKKH